MIFDLGFGIEDLGFFAKEFKFQEITGYYI